MSQHNGNEHNGDDVSPEEFTAAQLTAYALGQLEGEELAAFEAKFADNSDSTTRDVALVKNIATAASATRNSEPMPGAVPGLRDSLNERFVETEAKASPVKTFVLRARKKASWRRSTFELYLVGGIACALFGLFLLPAVQSSREAARPAQVGNHLRNLGIALQNYHDIHSPLAGSVEQIPYDVFVRERGEIVVPPYVGISGALNVTQNVLPSEIPFLEERLARTSDDGYRQVLEDELRSIKKRLDDSSGTEQYDSIIENPFLSPLQQPLSTFSIDVDTASYANMRRFLTSGRLPPPNSVRIEELVNYFRYDYTQPKDQTPFSVNMEVTECPWKEGNLVLRVGLKGKDVHRSERPASNLVFLLDVSGSMSDANKLPLLKTAMKLLVGELGENDRVSIVTYAGEAGLKLPPTRGHEQAKINRIIDSLSAGGSTNGSAGINLAYEQAAAYFVAGGTNRVILCTDGDLNVGITSDEALVKLIKQKAAGGVFLTVLGFGEGNLKDAKMEKLADNGNGLYAYIDSVREAKKVLVEQLTGSTITIAKDVKIQIEFNPAQIAAYRLLGYENRVLAAQDFNNDKKDAGEIGAGHTVTALYELAPVGAASDDAPPQPGTDPLKYQEPGASGRETEASPRRQPAGSVPLTEAARTGGELLTLKLRYKEPDGDTSKLLEYPLKDRGHPFHSASPDLQFAAAVASFGMTLRGSEHRGSSNLAAVTEIASAAIGKDPGGYRAEFIDLVRKAQSLGVK